MAKNLKTQFSNLEKTVKSTKISKCDESLANYTSQIQSTLKDFEIKSNEFIQNMMNQEHTKKKVEDAQIELMTLEIKIKHLNEEDYQVSRLIDRENNSYKTLKIIIDNKSKDYESLSLKKQESLVAEYIESLEKEPQSRLHSLLSLISTIQEITLKAIKSHRNTDHDLQRESQTKGNVLDQNVGCDKILDWNMMFCDYFKDEIIKHFDSDYQQELKNILIEKFDEIKSNSDINFVRWLNKIIKMDENAQDCDIEGLDADKMWMLSQVSQKKWQNMLKNISNHVAYIMKGSSFFTTYTNHITKYFSKDIEKTKLMKKLEIQFSAELFLRHNKLIQNVVKYEKSKPNIDDLNNFSKEICQYCSEEIANQEDYQNKFLYLHVDN